MNVLTRVGPVRTVVGFALGAVLLLVIAPAALSDFRLQLLGQYLCYALVGVGIGLAWGRGGMLTLGQGVFFGLGGYAMAMHLTLAQTDPGELPSFMIGSREELPQLWRPFASAWFAVPATVVLPMILAFLLGSLVFRRRVRGPYFAILSQALAAAFAILLVGQADITGGTNGLTGITSWFGYDLDDPINQTMVYSITAVALLVVVALARQLMHSRYGELLVAVRDSEERVRFLGYDPATVKIVAYTIAAGMAGLGGALFVSVIQFITPSQVGIVFSIEFVIGVAVGGRATLLGPVLGVVAVGWARSNLSDQFPSGWTYFQGGLFVLVVAFLPGGLASVLPIVKARLAERRHSPDEPPTAETPVVPGTTAGSTQEVNA